MTEYALVWNGFFIYKNPDGEEMIISTTNPSVKSRKAAPAVWLRKRTDSIERSILQIRGIAASVISLAINHYWVINNYDESRNPMEEPAKLEDLECRLYCRKTELFRTYMNAFAPIIHEVWEQRPTMPLECTDGDNWYSHLWGTERKVHC